MEGETISPFESDIKPYEEVRKLAAGQGEDYTTGFITLWLYQKSS